MKKITSKLISEKISEKIKSGGIYFGFTKKITDFVLQDFSYREDISDGSKVTIVFCICEYIEDNTKYSKAFEINI
ncbi:MAG: hypothetical protein EBS19_06615 [Spirochaetia bacterium]|nr:hypothetical protein [Spirochaetia bacterium]